MVPSVWWASADRAPVRETLWTNNPLAITRLVEAVLAESNVAVVWETRGERLERLFSMLGFYGKTTRRKTLPLRRDGRHYLRERVDGALGSRGLGCGMT
jgi:hypothetical protein